MIAARSSLMTDAAAERQQQAAELQQVL